MVPSVASPGSSFPGLRTHHPLQPLPSATIFGSAAPGFSSGQHSAMSRCDNTLPRGMGYDWTADKLSGKQVGYNRISFMRFP